MTREEIAVKAKAYQDSPLAWVHNRSKSSLELMTDFAMSIITEAEDKAWDAAREVEYEPAINAQDYKYDSPKDWRKETNNET